MSELIENHVQGAEDTQKGKYLTFMLGKEGYGLEIACVNEIIGILPITELPDSPHYVKGVVNLRGKVIPVMDVRVRFGMEEVSYNERTCIIVVKVNETMVGLIVDAVSEVADIPEENIEAPTSMSNSSDNAYIMAFGKIGNDVIILLKIESLLFDDTYDFSSSNAA